MSSAKAASSPDSRSRRSNPRAARVSGIDSTTITAPYAVTSAPICAGDRPNAASSSGSSPTGMFSAVTYAKAEADSAASAAVVLPSRRTAVGATTETLFTGNTLALDRAIRYR